ncbi:hypothetical protein [Streptomyces sp. NPDC005438]|uniref:hypothetical protein n=1 Tax=Streptomyces sp. NPDC005438 TaxID=3156880 RepID=UPI0033A332E0
MTVHGETAVVPTVTEDEAHKVLKKYTRVSNKANVEFDAELNSTVETGVLGSIDEAGLKSHKKVKPEGDPGYKKLKLTDVNLLIPQQAGWPKHFVADTHSSRAPAGRRWVYLFQRENAESGWKASYLLSVKEEVMPEFAKDKEGYAEPLSANDDSTLVPPEKLSQSYVTFLRDGGDNYAEGEYTHELRTKRDQTAKRNKNVTTEWTDTPAKPPQFEPYGLRTKGGGAFVFVASHHTSVQTVRKGVKLNIPPLVRAMMSGTPQRTVTYVRIAESGVMVPPRSESDGKLSVIGLNDGMTSAEGK